ncbi:MAG: hypothetical protein ONB15_07525 [candidate division KSB1 bacterium]|nr:hypothetical protein [candidate division KSB1 bacterium]
MDEFEKRKQELLQPIFFEAGAGLYDCQGFEYCVAYLLFLLSKLGVVGLDPADTIAILEHEAKKTAGQLVALLRQRFTLSDGIEEALADALEARNELIHRYFTANVERLVEPANHASIVKEIRRLRSRVRRVQRLLDPLVKGLAEYLYGLDLQQLAHEAKSQILRKWWSDG